MKIVKQIRKYLVEDIWRVDLRQMSRAKACWTKYLRVMLVAGREFAMDKCQLWSSTLTFYSLLSVVPILALIFGIAKGFSMEKMLERIITERMYDQQVIANQIIEFANRTLDAAKGGLVAGVGVVLLFWTVIQVLMSVENAFNDIWRIKRGRSINRRVADYLTIIVIAPFLLIMASSVTVVIASELAKIMSSTILFGSISKYAMLGLKILPYIFMWLLFSLIYMVLPNTKVNIRSGLLAGIIAGSLYQLISGVYFNFQIHVARLNAIYGSFAALPLFLIWLQISWRIVFFGAEIAYAHQNYHEYDYEPQCRQLSLAKRTLLALAAAHMLVKNLCNGHGPITLNQVSVFLGMPQKLARESMETLLECGLAVHTAKGYLPTVNAASLTVKQVIDRIQHHGQEKIPFAATREIESLSRSLAEFDQIIERSSTNVLLKDI